MSEHFNTMPTLQEIRKAHSWKRDYEKYLPLSRFIFRPLGFLLTWVAIRIGLTSEAVSWLSGIVGITGCLCLISKWKALLPAGIGLLLLFNLLDCVDGSIARTMKTENPYGRYLDSICGGIIDMAFWGVVGIVAFRNPDLLVWPGGLGYGVTFWLAVGGATCFFSIFVAFLERIFDGSLRPHWDRLQASRQNITDNTSENGKKPDLKSSHFNDRIRYAIRMINTNLRVRESHYLLFIVAYLFRTLDLLLLSYLSYYLSSIFLLMDAYTIRGRKIKRVYFL